MHFTPWSSNLCIFCHLHGPMCHLVEKVNLKRYCQLELERFTVESKKKKKILRKQGIFLSEEQHIGKCRYMVSQ